MSKTDILRNEFDRFLVSKNCNMTNEDVLKKAIDTENQLFNR